MTVFGRDCSDFDSDPINFSGLGFVTHKATEGTSITHARYGARLAAARDAGVPVLGAYHVLRTPGSGGAGSLAAQLGFWLGYLDAHTPWWKAHPYFILQIDAEKWPYDAVSAENVKQFAWLLTGAGVPGWKVTYASRGQYGDSLAGIATPLWNANYSGSSGGSYPGDGWEPGWRPYSGQTPVILQYTSTPYDKNAFRGSVDELRALIGGDMAITDDDIRRIWDYHVGGPQGRQPAADALSDTRDQTVRGASSYDGGKYGPVHDTLVAVRAIQQQLGTPAPVTPTDAQMQALGAQLTEVVRQVLGSVGTQLAAELARRLES